MAHLLLVEDNADLRETLAEILADQGYEVTEAEHGREALTLLQTGLRPHLAVVDLLMPVMSGGELLHAWQADSRLPRVPVLVFSATAGTHPPPSGVSAVLRKGITIDAVLGSIKELLEAA